MEPRYDLMVVKELASRRLNGGGGVWFSAPSRSLDCVAEVFSCDTREAENIILKGLLRLSAGDFHKSPVMSAWSGEVIDEYGLEYYRGHNWLIQCLVSADQGEQVLNQVSFYPTEDEMRLADGRLLSVTIDDAQRPNRSANARRNK